MVVASPFQRLERCFVSIVSQHNRDIAKQSAAFGSLNGAMLELAVEGFGGEAEQGYQVSAGRAAWGAEGCVSIGRGESIPRTDLLTDVTPEYPILHVWTDVFGDVNFVFDGEIGNATARIQGAIEENGVCRACIDAAGASPAMVSHEGGVGFEFEVEQDLGKQEIGTFLRMDQAGVFADPSEPCALGKLTFE